MALGLVAAIVRAPQAGNPGLTARAGIERMPARPALAVRPEFGPVGIGHARRRFLHMIDDQDFDPDLAIFQLQTKLLADRGDEVRTAVRAVVAHALTTDLA